MRWAMLAVMVAAAGLAACGGSASGGDAQQVRQVFDRQHELLRRQVWRPLYDMYTPTFQATCPYDDWVSITSAFIRGVDFDQLQYEDVHVSVSGDVAKLTYMRTYEGKQLRAVTAGSPDIYRRIDGAWYDDFDEHTTCL